MGMDLSGKGGYYRWNSRTWGNILKLGLHYGWMPTGTGPPRGILKADWSGIYRSNDGARFYARDARALADALEQALADMPKRQPPSMQNLTDYKYLVSPVGRKAVTEFIAYCRAGSFRIY